MSPTEDQLKAKIAALKKTKAANPSPKTEVTADPEANIAPAVNPAPAPVALHGAHVVQPQPEAPTPTVNQQPNPNEAEYRTFYGKNIHYVVYDKTAYFSVDDIIELANDPDCQIKLLEYKNAPSTKTEYQNLVKKLTFGDQKIDGAITNNALTIMRGLKLRAPGSFGRWLTELSSELTA